MQVTARPTGTAICSSYDLASLLLLPGLVNLTKPSPQTEQLREEAHKADRRKPAAEPQFSSVLADQAARSPVALLLRAERRMEPGSFSARREHLQQAATQSDCRRQAFQRDLVAAGTQQRPCASQQSAASASPDKAPLPEAGGPRGTTASVQRSAGSPSANASSPSAETAAAKPVFESRLPTTTQPAVGRNTGAVSVPAAPSVAATPIPASIAIQKSAAPSTVGGSAVRATPVPTVLSTVANTPPPAAPRTVAAQRAAGAGRSPRSSDTNVEQILRVVRSQIGRERASATLRLDLPQLGTIRLHLDLRDDALSLRVQTQTELAYRLLTEQAELLRQGLASSGISLSVLEISPPPAQQTDALGLSAQNPDGQPGSGASAEANAERSSPDGTEAPDADPVPTAVRAETEPAAESLVNLWA